MLTLGGRPFTTGRCSFLDADGIRDEPKIYIPVIPGDWQTPTLAQLDTGAAWSVLDTEIAEDLGLFDELGEHTNLSTRLGSMEGILVRTPFTLVAEEGTSLRIDATVFISRDWQEGTFLGYGGMLERIRFAVDPRENDFFFGSGAE